MTVPFCVRVCTCVLRDGRRHLVSSCLSFYLIFETEPSLKLELANQVEWLVREPRMLLFLRHTFMAGLVLRKRYFSLHVRCFVCFWYQCQSQGSGAGRLQEPGVVADFKEIVFSRLTRANTLVKL